MSGDLKAAKHELATQQKITSSSESSNRKYLSALVDAQSVVSNLGRIVVDALGDMATIKVERVDPKELKEEKKE